GPSRRPAPRRTPLQPARMANRIGSAGAGARRSPRADHGRRRTCWWADRELGSAGLPATADLLEFRARHRIVDDVEVLPSAGGERGAGTAGARRRPAPARAGPVRPGPELTPVRSGRTSAAGDGRDDRDLRPVLDLGVQAADEADVLVADVDVDEPSQLAALVDHPLLDPGVGRLQRVEQLRQRRTLG